MFYVFSQQATNMSTYIVVKIASIYEIITENLVVLTYLKAFNPCRYPHFCNNQSVAQTGNPAQNSSSGLIAQVHSSGVKFSLLQSIAIAFINQMRYIIVPSSLALRGLGVGFLYFTKAENRYIYIT